MTLVRLPRPLLWGPRSGVAAAHPLAVTAGMEVLGAGGNAVDAAVAAGAALAVVAPDACGLGGDALLLVAAPGRAPVAYVGGAALPARAILPFTGYGPASAGVPGAVAAWCAVHADHGRLPLAAVLAPGAALAADGFPVSGGLAAALERRGERLRAAAPGWGALGATAGSVLRQPELAATLEAIRARGADGFYRGAVATAIAGAVRTSDGRGIDPDDLAAYAVAAQEPVTAELRAGPPRGHRAALAGGARGPGAAVARGRPGPGHRRRRARRDRGGQAGLRAPRGPRRDRRRRGPARRRPPGRARAGEHVARAERRRSHRGGGHRGR